MHLISRAVQAFSRVIHVVLPVVGLTACVPPSHNTGPNDQRHTDQATATYGTTAMTTMKEHDVVHTPVPTVQPDRMTLDTPSGQYEIPIATTRDWRRGLDDVTRAVIVIHGWPRRDLQGGERALKAAGDAARGTIVITPQFVSANDMAAHHLSRNTLQWRENDWQKGYPSADAAALSSFAVVDEIFRRLSDRSVFPHLHMIVLAGHSAGGQFVQRYAAVGQGQERLGGAAIHVRYVVANPASYLYFTKDRPQPGGSFAPTDTASCPRYDRWSYGLQDGIPAYASGSESGGAKTIQARYLQRDVIYLLGTADDDPRADGLDTSCGGEAEGPTRLKRGLAYMAYIRRLDPQTTQRVLLVPGGRHLSYPMFSSQAGRSALFDSALPTPISGAE